MVSVLSRTAVLVSSKLEKLRFDPCEQTGRRSAALSDYRSSTMHVGRSISLLRRTIGITVRDIEIVGAARCVAKDSVGLPRNSFSV